jgi:hypothetical protein
MLLKHSGMLALMRKKLSLRILTHLRLPSRFALLYPKLLFRVFLLLVQFACWVMLLVFLCKFWWIRAVQLPSSMQPC